MPARDLLYGRHAVAAVLDRDPGGVRELWLQDGRRDALVQRLTSIGRDHGIAIHDVPRRTLDKMLDGARHQGIAIRYRAVSSPTVTDLAGLLDVLEHPPLLLVLDEVQDPHNLGACLRTCDAAGVDAVIVARRRAAGLTAVVRKVACGAAETVPLLEVPNLARALGGLADSGIGIVGAAAEAPQSLFDADLTGALALVLGGEEDGLRRLTRERCDRLVHIPMSGRVSSLNVSVAAGVCLFEARRQRALRPVDP